MAGKSVYLEDKWLNMWKGTAFTFPSTVYAALLTTVPSDDTGTGLVEVSTSGTAYARQAIVGSSGWSIIAPVSGGSGTTPEQMSNAAVITFPTPTANFGTVVGIALYDASTAGNLLYWASITSQVINTGVVASIAIGNLKVSDD
jgi:hypothetical protein